MITSFELMLEAIRNMKKKRISIAYAHDMDVLQAIKAAHEKGIAEAVLVGDSDKINDIAKKIELDLSNFEIIDEKEEVPATKKAVQLIRDGKAEVLMKGLCSTATFLRAILSKEDGLRTPNLISHLGIFDSPHYHKLILMSDAAMNIAPTLEEKIGITKNAIEIAKKFGVEIPKVAMITAVEKVNPGKMPATEDAALIAKMSDRKQIKGAIIDGPLAIDNAFSKRSCEIKGIVSEVGGDADIAICPDIESGNVFYKLMAYLSDAKTAGIILGSSAPIVLTSRSDSEEAKFLSIASACYLG